jgi:hypothetical protein
LVGKSNCGTWGSSETPDIVSGVVETTIVCAINHVGESSISHVGEDFSRGNSEGAGWGVGIDCGMSNETQCQDSKDKG